MSPYVTSYMRLQGYNANYEEMSWVVSLGGFIQTFSVFIGGKLPSKIGLRATCLLGGWLMSLGVALSCVTVQLGLMPFFLTYVVMFSAGAGMAYTPPLMCLMDWLPERNGLASGLVVFAYGSGALVFNVVQQSWTNADNLKANWVLHPGGQRYFNWHDDVITQKVLDFVPSLFLLLGIVYAAMQGVGAALLFEPRVLPSWQASQGLEEVQYVASLRAKAQRQYGVKEMVSTNSFWRLFAIYFCNAQGITFIASFEKTFVADTAVGDMSDWMLTMTAAIASLCNGLGRIFWGCRRHVGLDAYHDSRYCIALQRLGPNLLGLVWGLQLL
eukprot:gnl/TRDRNA2_/TRDRNA2_139901_c1_seq1.p1 gnl/TRDRNA2_/TRDRNA2_139901_c1~~gnl/TRDRNA2_/TRDRNA2_139901_c1_seq1.p1  ORF type:complete len:354 (+),score=38.79 gnl/TRDRNA2_/TRDRNA2_139901_c1_seq1:84-1064(+)